MGDAKGLIRDARSAATFCLGASYLANVLLKIPLLDDVSLILTVIVVAMSFAASTGSSRVIGAVLFCAGASVLLVSRAPLDVWAQALRENSYLIVMFIMVPLLGIPVQHGGYGESLREVFARHADTAGRYYLLVSGMSAIVGALISIAAVPLAYEVSRTSRHSEDKRLFGSALTRGFVTCMIWAPTSATIALVIQLTGVDWMELFPFAIACAVIAEAIGFLMTLARGRAAGGATVAAREPACDFSAAKIVELGAFAVLLVASILVVSQAGGLSIIVVVAMASLVFPIAWMAAIRRLPAYARAFRGDYFHKKLPQLKNQVVLFAGAGLFAHSIGYSHLGDAIAQALLFLTGQNALLLTATIVALVLATSALGVHPIVVVTVVGGAVGASTCGVTPIYLALVLSMSWAMGNAICPASANVIAVSDMVGRSPVKVGLRWNGPYVLAATAVLVGFLALLRAVGLL